MENGNNTTHKNTHKMEKFENNPRSPKVIVLAEEPAHSLNYNNYNPKYVIATRWRVIMVITPKLHKYLTPRLQAII
jgi:hypothetical protein